MTSKITRYFTHIAIVQYNLFIYLFYTHPINDVPIHELIPE